MRNLSQDELRQDFHLFGRALGAGIVGLIFFIIFTGFIIEDFLIIISQSAAYPILASIVSFSLLSAFLYRSKTWEARSHPYLLLLLVSSVGFNVFQIFNWDVAELHTPFQRPVGVPLLYIADSFIPIIIIALYLHFESLYREGHDFRFSIVIGLLTLPNFALVVMAIFGFNLAVEALALVLPFLVIAALITTIYGIRIVFDIFIISTHRKAKRYALTTMIGLFYLVFAFVTQIFTADRISFGLFEATIYQLLIFALGIVLIGISYIIEPAYLHATTSHVFEMIIFDDHENLIWSHDFDLIEELDPEISRVKMEIISTVMKLLDEVSGFSDSIYRIDFSETNCLMVLTDEDKGFHLVVLVSEPSSQLQVTLYQFQHQAMEKIRMENTDEIDDLLQEFFPQYF